MVQRVKHRGREGQRRERELSCLCGQERCSETERNDADVFHRVEGE
jgi:hypothetical protein